MNRLSDPGIKRPGTMKREGKAAFKGQSGQINKVILVPEHACVYVPNVTCLANREHSTRGMCPLPVL